MKISWLDLKDRVGYELTQLKEEGCDVSALNEKWEHIKSGFGLGEIPTEIVENFYKELSLLTPAAGSRKEPSGWEEIRVAFPASKYPKHNLSSAELENRILGGWLGRSAGCLLGKPIEKTPRNGIIELLSSNNTWPITDYITGKGIPDELLKKYPWNKHSGKESLKENIECMTEDDDMNYPMLNLSVLEKYGKAFSTSSVAQTWMELLPVLSTFTAERVTYLNLLNGLGTEKASSVRNPYREWIGAQIRADLWGWAAPGDPHTAADSAWRDARLSHSANGIYGEVFFAAALALSFTYNDMRSLITEALRFVPANSRFAAAINYVLSLEIENEAWDSTVDLLYGKFGDYHWVHTINNAALVSAALLSAKGDYETAVCNVVMGGWDTDSNGATTGSIMGTMLGADSLPAKWIKPLNNRIRSGMKGFDNLSFDILAKRTFNIAITT